MTIITFEGADFKHFTVIVPALLNSKISNEVKLSKYEVHSNTEPEVLTYVKSTVNTVFCFAVAGLPIDNSLSCHPI